jgi:acetylglutamate kinase
VSRHGWVVLKLGGELLEDPVRLQALAAVIARSAAVVPLAVVHGGGREIDVALARAGLQKRQVDGLRITDAATLDVVVEVLAGSINTRFVAAINAAGGQAVGLTGADARLALVEPAPPHVGVDGSVTDLGFVGRPLGSRWPRLLLDLGEAGYVPVVASLGTSLEGALYNVNADTLAAHLAGRLAASRLVMAGATPGVLDDQGRTVHELRCDGVAPLIASRVASAGMVAKLRACEDALAGGAAEVLLVDGREPHVVESVLTAQPGHLPDAPFTRMVA